MPLMNPSSSSIPTQQAWIAPTLINGWGNWPDFSPNDGFGSAGYWRDSFGVVQLRGVVRAGSLNSAIFVLPTGFRPPNRLMLIAMSGSSGTVYMPARIDIYPSGNVIQHSGSNYFLSLDGINFRAS